MFGSRGTGEEVTCIACGESIRRADAREYDKEGDRWQREDKEFEFLCKPCYKELCHQPRDGLEDRLVEIGAGVTDRDAFLDAFVTEDRSKTNEPEE